MSEASSCAAIWLMLATKTPSSSSPWKYRRVLSSPRPSFSTVAVASKIGSVARLAIQAAIAATMIAVNPVPMAKVSNNSC